MTRNALISLLLIWFTSSTVRAQFLSWDAGGASPPNGVFDVAANWNPDQVPGGGSTVFFGVDAIYTVTFDADHTGNITSILNGEISWLSDSATIRSYMLGTLAVGGGESLTIGSQSLPVQVSTGRVEIGTPATSNDGTVIVDGANSQLIATSTTNTNVIGGSSTQSGTLRYQNNAQGAFFNTLNIGSSNNDGSDGLLEVLSGAELIADDLNVGTSTSTAMGTINVSGAGSDLDQVGPHTLTVGSATGGAGTINVSGGGSFTTGTGLTTVNATGTINRTGTGVFNVDGDLLLDGGQFLTPGGDYNHAAGKTITAQNGGLFSATPPNAGTNQNGAAGPTLTSSGMIDLNDATLELRGGRGANASFNFSGRAGGTGGTMNVTGGQTALSGSATLSVAGGPGGNSNIFFDGGNGGSGGFVTIGNGTFTITNQAVLSLTGGSGQTEVSSTDESGGHGGDGGRLEITGGAASIAGEAVIRLAGGRGGNGGFESRGGDGGDGGTLSVAAGSLTQDGGLISTAGGASGFGLSGGTSGVAGTPGLVEVTGGTFTINGGEVFTGSFTRTGGTFNFNDGKLTTSGGTFDVSAASAAINGSSPAALPTLVLDDGATAPALTGPLTVGATNRGRVELRAGSSLSTDTALLGDSFASEGQVLVDGNNSQWTVTGGGFNVGFEGTGNLTVSGGGHVQVTGGSLLVGGSPDANGAVHVTSGGSLTADNLVTISDIGIALVTVDGGGTLTAGNHIRVGGLAPFSNGTLNVSGAGSSVHAQASLNVGGTQTSSNDGPGELNISGGSVDVATTLRVWNGGTANFSGGTLTADTINHSLGGAFNFTGGALSVDTFDGALAQDGGTLSPGESPGVTNITGDYNLNAGAIEIELFGAGGGAGANHDQVSVAGTATLGGELLVDIDSGFTPQSADAFIVLTAGALVGTFANVGDGGRIGTLDGLGSFVVSYDRANNQVVLADFLAEPFLAGDYNANGVVDAADYAVWRDNLGASPGTLLNDADGGVIGAAHYTTWKTNFGNALPPSSLVSGTVPEPSTGVLLILCALASTCRYRRAIAERDR